MNEQASVALMMCWMRSGGTLMNRCLASLPNTIVLSEVHPRGGGGSSKSPKTVKEQARRWHQLEIESTDFAAGISELSSICHGKQKNLIVREYSIKNFKRNKGELECLHLLKNEVRLNTFAFVRHPIDVALSWGKTDEESFCRLANYSQSLKTNNVRIFKYEDFCSDAVLQMKEICAHIEIPFDIDFLKFKEVEKVNGDLNFKGGTSRGLRSKNINLPPRKWASKKTINTLQGSDSLKRACHLLGYSPKYVDSKIDRESRFKNFRETLRVSLSRLSKKIANSASSDPK